MQLVDRTPVPGSPVDAGVARKSRNAAKDGPAGTGAAQRVAPGTRRTAGAHRQRAGRRRTGKAGSA